MRFNVTESKYRVYERKAKAVDSSENSHGVVTSFRITSTLFNNAKMRMALLWKFTAC